MRKRSSLTVVVLLGLLFIFAAAPKNRPRDIKGVKDISGVKPHIHHREFPLHFIANKGQVNEKAAYYARAAGYTLWLTKEGFVFDSVKKTEIKKKLPHSPHSPHSTHSPKTTRDVSRLIFVGAGKNPVLIPLEEAALKVNYFIGNDGSKWHTNVPTSMAVLYKGLYKNIDLKVYGIEKQIEYDWIVNPGGNPGDIRFQYKNVKGTRIDEKGNLLIETDSGELMHKKPVCYQRRGLIYQTRIEVTGRFKKTGENTYGFEVGDYDKRTELVIDPVVLAYSTYLGGGLNEQGRAIDVDGSGCVYVTGRTFSTNFPTQDPYQGALVGPAADVFVTKIDTTQGGGASLIYSTYLGGDSADLGHGIAVDAGGNAYVTGYTGGSDFPVTNQYQGDQGGDDVFLTKIAADGASLLYSTYLGGGSFEEGLDIAVDGSGNAYVTGFTNSTLFPTRNQNQANQTGLDAFVTKIDTTQSGDASLIYSTYLGGGDTDQGNRIAVDGSGNAYVTGSTLSTNFPTKSPYQSNQTGWDAFVTKIDTTQSGGASLIYSTYLGWDGLDEGFGIAVDGSGRAYVTGFTDSTDFPTLNPYQTNQTGTDVFVTKIAAGGSSLVYSTYLGGGNDDYSYGLAIDGSGNAYVTGYTTSTGFPILNQNQSDPADSNTDAFVTKIDTTQSGGASLIYSTYLGGGDGEEGRAIAVDAGGNAYVAGYTTSMNFPTANQYQGSNQGGEDVFVTTISAFPGPPTVDTPTSADITPTTATLGGNVSSINGANVTERGVYWSTTDGFTPPGQGTNVSETGDWGTGAFTVPVTGLPPGTTIYFRAYAVNSAGTGYSAQDSFPTPPLPPTVTTDAVTNITATTATCGGDVTLDGGAPVTSRGVCWSTSTGPTVALSTKTTDGSGTGSFTSSITGLTPATTYYVRAYAVNSAGTSYGNEVSFDTADNPSISGRIADGNSGVGAVTLTFSNGGGNTSSLSDGTYSHIVDYGWSGTVTPAKQGYTFEPPNQSYPNVVSAQTGQDYTATAITFEISGKVTTGGTNGTGVSDVILTFSNGGDSTATTTDAGGSYSHAVDYGWSGTVTPEKDGYTFDPVNKSYPNVVSAQTGQDYTATAITFEISGKVTTGGTNGTGVSDVILTFSNGGGSTATTAGGIYSHAVDYGWSGTVTPEKDGYTFDPVNKSYPNVVSAQTGQDYTAEVITLEISGKVTTGGTGGTGGTGVSGVILTFSNGGGSTATTAGGIYSHAVDYGWSGTVTPEKDGYTFDPVNKSYPNVVSAQTGQDYTAIPIPPVISGRVVRSTESGIEGFPGVRLVFSSESSGTAIETTDADGYYQHEVPYQWSGHVTPSKTGYDFFPSHQTYTGITTDHPNQDYTAAEAVIPEVSISGTVTNSQGAGIPSVVLTFSNGGEYAVTDANGQYDHTVNSGWFGIVTPTKSGYSFDPSDRSYDNVTSDLTGQDYTAAEVPVFISGKVTGTQGTGISGVVLTFSNGEGGVETATTDFNGVYQRELPHGWSGEVTPSKQGYEFQPPNRTYGNVTSDRSGQDYTADTTYPIISGTVADDEGTGVPGVTLTFAGDNGTSSTADTDADGNYSHPVEPGWSGTASPFKIGYIFSPPHLSYSNVTSDRPGENYTAEANSPVISGIVTDPADRGIPGVRLEFTGAAGSGYTYTNTSGIYTNAVPLDWTGTVTPLKKGYEFEPPFLSYVNVNAHMPDQNYKTTSVLLFISGKIATPEGEGIDFVTLTFSNSGGSAVTDPNGGYVHPVDYLWSGTVTPSKKGYTFSPVRNVYPTVTDSFFDQDFEAHEILPVISGRVTHSTSAGILGLAGVNLVFSDGGGTTGTDTGGYYNKEVLKGWTGTATPVKEGFVFRPSSYFYADVRADQPGRYYTAVSSGYDLTLTAERKETGSLTIRKQYGEISLTAESTGATPAARYIVYRRENNGNYRQNKEITPAQLGDGGTYTYTDGYLEPDKTYTYKAEARDSAGRVIGISEEIEI